PSRADEPGGGARARRLTVQRGRVTAPLPIDPPGTSPSRVDRLRAARWTADHTGVEVTLEDTCMEREQTRTFTLAALEARLDNAAALALQRGGHHAEAALGFAKAAAADPSFDLARTNLVAALATAGRRAEAIDAARPLVTTNPVLVTWEALHDPEWASVAGADELVALHAPAPGTATVATLASGAAYSERLGVIAAMREESLWGADVTVASEVVFLDRSGARLAVIPSAAPGLDRLLAVLGFVPGEVGEPPLAPGPERMRFRAARLGLVYAGDHARVIRAGKVVVEAPRQGDRLVWATRVPGAIVVAWVDPGSEGCDATDPTGLDVIAVP
ncbi:MAG TPA: hypothetical protein VHE35_25325, partial [Kofleriaceae bacterium]|nr:hypothetical protein [Kofleriaceae bacterium]